ncbi:recombination protein NinB [Erwiniaceae bacterium BAC15a-03b]|uniref:Recombination protein NinB n=1 Tax=Winslowiella arboricola TaxID=2978220 RepID=A0A9J6PYB2_9GAMM|nr:recombination protein NinB [Winslowiella arboricola]MCU5775098.1 recombination protein NinB [Winslowiella arboricola]MCU5780448.1 recombination protein NinB [Winslowiella arboricola]
MKQTFVLRDSNIRRNCIEAIQQLPANPAKPLQVIIQEDTRSLAQNRMLWACLHDISQQVIWYGRKMDSESWKHVFTASLKEQETVPGIDGGFVVLGQSTSKMRVSEMKDLITLMHAFGAEHNVRFSDEAALAAEWAGRFGSAA